MSVNPFAGVSDYLTTYGAALVAKVQATSVPRHRVGKDELPDFSGLLRQPIAAQAHVIAAGIKAIPHEKSVWLNCDMGTGKSFLSIAAVHLHACGRPYRAMVICPPHLKEKWVREIEATIPNVNARIVNRYFELVPLAGSREKPTGSEWWVMSGSAAKLGQPWEPVIETVRLKKTVSLGVGGMRTQWHYGRFCCPRCKWPLMKKNGPIEERHLSREEVQKQKRTCENCGEFLWQWSKSVDFNQLSPRGRDVDANLDARRWPIAKFVQRKMRGMFDYLVVDEVHDAKGESSAIANAVGKMASACKHVVVLTGTLLGGYATDIYGLLWRLSPETVLEDGLAFGQEEKFAELYGRIETTVTKKKDKKKTSNAQSEGSSGSKRLLVRPGIMPTLFARHLMDKTIFLRLDELAANLPAIDESVIHVPMDGEQRGGYLEIAEAIQSAFQDLINQPNGISALRRLMWALMGYPDRPYDWGEIGYHADNGEWIGVCAPQDLDPETVRPKESAIVSEIVSELNLGRKCWTFCQMTKTRDVQPRLAKLLEAEGLRVKILRSATVSTDKREAWIAKNGPDADVIISHPILVQTGLELFDKAKRYNFPTILWYQTGYSLYTLRQASRRSWRIGQDQDCKIRYFAYADSVQQDCMNLMSQKLQASQQLEGRLDMNGLASLAAESESVEMALAKSLATRLSESVKIRAWEKANSVRQ